MIVIATPAVHRSVDRRPQDRFADSRAMPTPSSATARQRAYHRQDYDEENDDPKDERAAVHFACALLFLRRQRRRPLGGFLRCQFDLRADRIDARVECARNVARL